MNKQQVEIFQAALKNRGNQLTQSPTFDLEQSNQFHLRAAILQDIHDVLEEYKNNLPENPLTVAMQMMEKNLVLREKLLNTLQPDAEDLATDLEPAAKLKYTQVNPPTTQETLNRAHFPSCKQCTNSIMEHFHCPKCGNRLSFKETQCCNCEYKL